MSADKIDVLLVEDSPSDALLVRDELEHAIGSVFSVVHLEQLSEALARLAVQRFDVVLLDLSLPDAHGLETFVRLHHAVSEIPIVVLSGRADEDLAVKAVQAGAQDYLVKGRMGEDVLQRSLRYAIERRRTQRSLAESDERYRLLVEQSPDAILVHAKGNIVFANAAALKLFGAVTVAEVQGRRFLDFIATESHESIGRSIRSAEANSGSGVMELVGLRLDGTTVAVEGTSHLFSREASAGIQVILRDITERKRSEERFRWLVDSHAQGVMFWNTKGEITEANDAFLSLVGFSRGELESGRINWQVLTPAEYVAADGRAMLEIRARGFCTPYEKEFVRKDGSCVSILIGASVFKDNPEEGVGFTIDLTERNKRNQDSLRAQRMESIGTLAGGIAHDLNNSLGPIITALYLLRERFVDADSKALLDIVSSSAQRGADMVRQVLSFARGVEGRRMEVQLKHLIIEIQNIAYDTFPKNIQVRSTVPNDLWTVQGDPTQLHQVLLNLCMNARDAMPRGGVLTVTGENLLIDKQYAGLDPSRELKPGPYIVIQLTDSGTGMPPEVIAKIFDPFFTTKEVGKGTGLGLSTSLTILENHGGSIRVDSELEKGTKFSIFLPAQTERTAQAVGALAAELPRGRGELILIVDDETALRQITQMTLEEFGYKVVPACDGADAVTVYARQGAQVAVVLLDMMMPIMDGSATIQVLRRINPGVRIIATSGLSSGEHNAHLASLGVNQFLSKPYTAQALLKALKLVLSEGVPSGSR